MTLNYNEIGQRLRAFRLGSGLSADDIAKKIGISRTAVYRFEKGEVVKIETLISLAEMLGVSLPSLLGVEMEYISSAVTYFERLRQIEEDAERITIVAGPLPFLLSSDDFHKSLFELQKENQARSKLDKKSAQDVERILEILSERKKIYAQRRPSIVNLISGIEIERLLRAGFVGRPFMSDAEIAARKERAANEVEYFASILDSEPIGIQIGVVTEPLPNVGFQIFRTGSNTTLTIAPFRLAELNIRLGVAMITTNKEAVSLHEKVVDEHWQNALRGKEAATYLRDMIKSVRRSEAKSK